MVEEGKMARLEEELRQVLVRADAADKRFDEVQVKHYKKMMVKWQNTGQNECN